MEIFPENTELGFNEALRVGSHGLETGSFSQSSELSRRCPYVQGWDRGDMS